MFYSTLTSSPTVFIGSTPSFNPSLSPSLSLTPSLPYTLTNLLPHSLPYNPFSLMQTLALSHPHTSHLYSSISSHIYPSAATLTPLLPFFTHTHPHSSSHTHIHSFTFSHTPSYTQLLLSLALYRSFTRKKKHPPFHSLLTALKTTH